jgi:hypothetical protein
MRFKENWEETKQRFEAWWNRSQMDRPMMNLVAVRKEPLEGLEALNELFMKEDYYFNVEYKAKKLRNYCRTHIFLADAFPCVDVNIGPGCMAIYLGCKPIFRNDTVWYEKCVECGWEEYGPIQYDPDNIWWKRHLQFIIDVKQMSGDDFCVGIPDFVENLDILSLMRGLQETCYDIVDQPEIIHSLISQLDDIYFKFYDTVREIIREEDGSGGFGSFSIWGSGKTAKIQSDFCALMSPEQFRKFVIPSLRNQCRKLDHSLFHLDGRDAIKHVDALLEIDELDAVQWVAGAGQPDGASELWYPLYDKIRSAGKALQICIGDGQFNDWIDGAKKIVKRYGPDGLYFFLPEMDEDQAEIFLNKAENKWR